MSEWSKIVEIVNLPSAGKSYSLEANDSQCRDIAKRLSIPGVRQFSGDVDLQSVTGGILIEGNLTGELDRVCSLSLESMIEKVEEKFSVRMLRNVDDTVDGDDILLSDESIEPLEGDSVDIADFLTQQLAIAMTPWPKIDDAESLTEEFGKTGDISPFSLLKTAFKDTPEEN